MNISAKIEMSKRITRRIAYGLLLIWQEWRKIISELCKLFDFHSVFVELVCIVSMASWTTNDKTKSREKSSFFCFFSFCVQRISKKVRDMIRDVTNVFEIIWSWLSIIFLIKVGRNEQQQQWADFLSVIHGKIFD